MLYPSCRGLLALAAMAVLAVSTLQAQEPIQINFQTAGAPTPTDWHADTGEAFGSRSGGLSYGWNADISSTARQRNSARSPDVQHDTLVHLQKPVQPNAVWEIAVPVGRYRVTLLAGDPSHTDSDYRLSVEGVLVLDHNPSSSARWAAATAEVSVADGRLTISLAAGASNNKLGSVVIEAIPMVNPDPLQAIKVNFQSPTAPIPDGWLSDTGRTFGPRVGDVSYGWNSDVSATARHRNAANSPDLQHDILVHLQKSVAPNAFWDIAVPDGQYEVTLLAGDPNHIDSHYALAVQGETVLEHQPSNSARWAEATAAVSVDSGLLSISSAPGARNNKLNSVVITPLGNGLDGERVGPFRWARKLAGDLDDLDPGHIAADGTVENAHLVDEDRIRLTAWSSSSQAGTRNFSANTLIADPGSHWSVGLRGWENSEALDTGEGWIRVARMSQDAHLRLGYAGANRGPHDATHGATTGFDGPLSEDAIVVALAFRRHTGTGNSTWQTNHHNGNPVQWGVWQIPAGHSLAQAQQNQANRLATLDALSEISPDQPFNVEFTLGDAGYWQVAVDLDGDGQVDVERDAHHDDAQPSTLNVDMSGGLMVTASPAGGTGAGRVGITSLDLNFRPGEGLTDTQRDRRPILLEPTHASRVSPALVTGRAWDDQRSLSLTPSQSLVLCPGNSLQKSVFSL